MSGRTARRVALDALARIDDGAYANLVLPSLLERSGLDDRDRRFATDLVYGTTRMRRACDFLVDRFLMRPAIDPDVLGEMAHIAAEDLLLLGQGAWEHLPGESFVRCTRTAVRATAAAWGLKEVFDRTAGASHV